MDQWNAVPVYQQLLALQNTLQYVLSPRLGAGALPALQLVHCELQTSDYALNA